MKKITIKLKSELTTEELDEIIEEMLWDSKYSYYFDDNEWEIENIPRERDPEQKHWDDLATYNERFSD